MPILFVHSYCVDLTFFHLLFCIRKGGEKAAIPSKTSSHKNKERLKKKKTQPKMQKRYSKVYQTLVQMIWTCLFSEDNNRGSKRYYIQFFLMNLISIHSV